MLIEFAYGAGEFQNHWAYVSNTQPELTKKEIFNEWGGRCSKHGDYSYQLIDIDNSLIFGLITSGLPDKCILYYDVRCNKMYFTGNISNIYSFRNPGNMSKGYASLSTPHDSFDWGEYYKAYTSDFCFEVPEECFDDFYEAVKPYYEYDFTKQLVKLCNNSFNIKAGDSAPAPIAESTPKVIKSYQLDCSAVFWELLIHDMFEGELYNSFSEKYYQTVEDLVNTLTGLQNHYSTYGNTYYDPRN